MLSIGEGASDEIQIGQEKVREGSNFAPEPLQGRRPKERETNTTMSYKSSFQDRAGQAAEAKKKALEKFKARPPVDEKVVAERVAAAEKREAANAEKAAAKKAQAQAASEAAEAKAAQAAAAEEAAKPVVKTEAELKAARDARYAKRKARR
jgi:hypothetical protein